MRYFKTLNPLSMLYLSGGKVVKWFTSDGVEGWFSTLDPVVAEQLATYASKKIGGGISEVSQAEYEGALGKAKGRRYEPDREWVDKNGLQNAQAHQSPSAEVAAVVDPPTPQTIEPPKPTVRRRART